MHRTTIMIPDSLRLSLIKEAEREKLTFGEIVRRALQGFLLMRRGATAHDPFFSSQTVFQDEGPTDGAEHHDDYLVRPDVHGH